MAENSPLPSPKSLDELVDFFDSHDMGDDWDKMPEADFDIDIKSKKHLVAIDEKLMGKLMKIAKSKHTSSEILINSWLKEQLRRAG